MSDSENQDSHMTEAQTASVKITSAGSYHVIADDKEYLCQEATINGEHLDCRAKQVVFYLPYHEIETTDEAINLIIHEES